MNLKKPLAFALVVSIAAFAAATCGRAVVVKPAHGENGAPFQPGSLQTVGAIDKQPAGAVYRYGLSSADAAQITTASFSNPTIPEFDNAAGRQTIPATAFFTNAGATVSVYLVAYWRDPSGIVTGFKVSPVVLFTAPAALPRDPSGNYVAPTYAFDAMGGRFLRLYMATATSAGTVAFGLGSQ